MWPWRDGISDAWTASRANPPQPPHSLFLPVTQLRDCVSLIVLDHCSACLGYDPHHLLLPGPPSPTNDTTVGAVSIQIS